jgi:hypothetical protein
MTNIRSPFASRLRTARNEAGHRTASAAARSLGVPVPTVVAHEAAGSNHRVPNGEHLAMYAKAYGVSVEWLLNGVEPKPPKVSIIHKVEERRLTSILGGLAREGLLFKTYPSDANGFWDIEVLQ